MKQEKRLRILFGNTIFRNRHFTVGKANTRNECQRGKAPKPVEKNHQLKELVANLTLDNHIKKSPCKKQINSAEKRRMRKRYIKHTS